MSVETMEPTTTEAKELERLESKIEQGVYGAKMALLEVRDRRLYRATYGTFEAYIEQRWGWTRQRGYQLIEAAEVLKEIAADLPEGERQTMLGAVNDRQLAELAKSPKGERAAALKEATETAPKKNGQAKTTAAHVQKVVAKRKEPEPAPDTTSSVDRTPAVPWSDFATAINGIISDIRSASRKLNTTLDADSKSKELRATYARFYSHAGTIGALNAVVRNLEDNMPAAASDKPPGYVPARVVESRKSMAEGRV